MKNYQLETLIRLACGRDKELAERAVDELLARNEVAAKDYILEVFLGKKWPERRAAAVALDRLDPTWFQSPLISAALPGILADLHDSGWVVRERAAWALGRTKREAMVPHLAVVLDDPDDDVRRTAAKAIRACHRDPSTEMGRDKVLALLIDALGSPAAGIRQRAVSALAETKVDFLPSILSRKLDDPDPSVRNLAGETLEQLRWKPPTLRDKLMLQLALEDSAGLAKAGSAALTFLAECVETSDPKRRRIAGAALGRIRNGKASSILVNMLLDSDSQVRQCALRSLSVRKWEPRAEREFVLLALSWDIPEAAARGPASIPVLLEALRCDDPQVKKVAIAALGLNGDSAAAGPLSESLKDPKVRDVAERSLRQINRPETVDSLLTLLATDVSERTAESAIRILAVIGDPRAVEVISTFLLSGGSLAEEAAAALQGINHPSASTVLLTAATSSFEKVRALAAESLAGSSDERTLTVLSQLMRHDGVPMVRREAAKALASSEWRPLDKTDRYLLAVFNEESCPLLDDWPESLDLLRNELLKSDARGRRFVAEMLGQIDDQRTVGPLLDALSDQDMGVRQVALDELRSALGQPHVGLGIVNAVIQDTLILDRAARMLLEGPIDWRSRKEVRVAVAAFLDDISSERRDKFAPAARALGLLQVHSGFSLLIQLLGESSEEVREAAAWALGQIGDSAAEPHLKKLLSDRSREVRWATESALSALGVEVPSVVFANGVFSHGAQFNIGSEVHHARLVTDPVQLLAFSPRTVELNQWYPLTAYMYRLKAESEVEADADDHLGGIRANMSQLSARAQAAISKGATITAQPAIPGTISNPETLTLGFYEEWHRFDFRICPVDAQVGQVLSGTVRFSLEGLLVGEVRVSLSLVDQPSDLERERFLASVYQKIFASYSRGDRNIVERVERAYRILGIEYLRDVNMLRSGERWSERLLDLVREADIFQLFWSFQSARSKNVKREWEYALSLAREAFIRPVYWENPRPPFPRRLRHLHFAFEPRLADDAKLLEARESLAPPSSPPAEHPGM